MLRAQDGRHMFLRGEMSKKDHVAEREARTVHSHAVEVHVKTAFVFDKRFIALFVCFDPVADIFSQLQMMRWGSMELIGQSTKQAVAVAKRGCGVQP